MTFLLAPVAGDIIFVLRFGLLFASFVAIGIHESDLAFSSHLALSEPRVVGVVREPVVGVCDSCWPAVVTFIVVIFNAFNEFPETSTAGWLSS